MYSQLMVEGDRNNGFHGAVIKKLSDFDICDLHNPVLRVHKDKMKSILYIALYNRYVMLIQSNAVFCVNFYLVCK